MGVVYGSGSALGTSVETSELSSTLQNQLLNLNQAQLEQGLNILINSVAASSTLNAWDDMFVDEFTDSNGTSNTIDTGNTTAQFSTDKYQNEIEGESVHGVTLGSGQATTAKRGMKINTNQAGTITKVTKHASCSATHAYILNSSETQLASAAFSGNDATFSQAVTDATNYYVVVDKEGASYNEQYGAAGGGYPFTDTECDFTARLSAPSTEDTDFACNVTGVTISSTPANKIVQTNAITITANPQTHQVFCHNTTAGSGTITYDISFDNGSTYVTGQAVNTLNTSVHAGSQMILKLNLNGTGAGNTAEADDYGVMLGY